MINELEALELAAAIHVCLRDKKLSIISKGNREFFAPIKNVKHIISDRQGGYILIKWND